MSMGIWLGELASVCILGFYFFDFFFKYGLNTIMSLPPLVGNLVTLRIIYIRDDTIRYP